MDALLITNGLLRDLLCERHPLSWTELERRALVMTQPVTAFLNTLCLQGRTLKLGVGVARGVEAWTEKEADHDQEYEI